MSTKTDKRALAGLGFLLAFALLAVLSLSWTDSSPVDRGPLGGKEAVPAQESSESTDLSIPGLSQSQSEDLTESEASAASLPNGAEQRVELLAPSDSLKVITAEGLSASSKRIGKIGFEVWQLEESGATSQVFVGQTNLEGEWKVDLEEGEYRQLPLESGFALFVRVVEPGYQQYRARVENFWEESGSWRVHLLVTDGATLRGQVLDTLGRGTEATVQVTSIRGESLVPGSAELIGAVTGTPTYFGQGRFEIHFTVGGEIHLFAARPGIGTGVVRNLEIDLEHPSQDIRIHLAGKGLLRGTLKSTDGEPASGHTLLVRLAELDAESPDPQMTMLKEPHASELRLEGKGYTWQRVVTDDQGMFLAEGLRAGEYIVRAGREPVAHRYPLLLTDEPVWSDGVPLELHLRSAAEKPE